jgi:hypothetical protein
MPEIQPYMFYIAMAAVVLVVLLLLTALFRRLRSGTRGGRGLRLGINEYCEIDESRRLVLVRRDNVEHLVLIGGPQDLVIESGIGAGAVAKHPVDEAVAATRNDDVVPFRTAPRAPVFGAKRPSLHTVDDNNDGNGPKLA